MHYNYIDIQGCIIFPIVDGKSNYREICREWKVGTIFESSSFSNNFLSMFFTTFEQKSVEKNLYCLQSEKHLEIIQ